MSRQDIHFGKFPADSAEKTSSWKENSKVFILLNVKMFLEHGGVLLLSQNGAFLTEGFLGMVPPKFFKAIFLREALPHSFESTWKPHVEDGDQDELASSQRKLSVANGDSSDKKCRWGAAEWQETVGEATENDAPDSPNAKRGGQKRASSKKVWVAASGPKNDRECPQALPDDASEVWSRNWCES